MSFVERDQANLTKTTVPLKFFPAISASRTLIERWLQVKLFQKSGCISNTCVAIGTEEY